LQPCHTATRDTVIEALPDDIRIAGPRPEILARPSPATSINLGELRGHPDACGRVASCRARASVEGANAGVTESAPARASIYSSHRRSHRSAAAGHEQRLGISRAFQGEPPSRAGFRAPGARRASSADG
jgi:hypothetical protein